MKRAGHDHRGLGAEPRWGLGGDAPGKFLENIGVLLHLRAIPALKLLKIYF